MTSFFMPWSYDERPWGIKIIVVRHHRRNPKYGMRRA
jgi:hypothetical protein